MKLGALLVISSLTIGAQVPSSEIDPAGYADADAFSSILATAFPEILEESQPNSTISPIASDDGITIATDSPSENELLDSGAQLVPPPTVYVEFATGVIAPEIEGVYRLEVEDKDSVAFLQETQWGYRIISTIGSSDSPTAFSYDVDLPHDTRMDETADLIYMVGPSEEVLATLEVPWARDANGLDVHTYFTWSEGVLTQHVELTGSETFPVLADPAWSYSYSYNTGKTPVAVERILKSCFNCHFPVAGAPRNFPTFNQLLPLTVAFNNYECTMGRLERTSTTFNFGFVATRNHFHGQGSTIKFSFRSDNRLYVNARINNGWINNAVYRAAAAANWAVFANNLRNAS